MTLTGTLDEQMRAIDLILSKLCEDPHYSQAMHAPFSYAGVFSFIWLPSLGDSYICIACLCFMNTTIAFYVGNNNHFYTIPSITKPSLTEVFYLIKAF